jgi:hypothetical protein
MKKHLLLSILSVTAFAGYSQVNVLSGTGIKVLPGTELRTSGLSLASGSTMSVAGTLKLTDGSLTNHGSLEIPGSLALENPGSGGLTVDGSSPFNIGTLRINTPSGVAVSNILTIDDSVQFQHGIISIDTSTPLHFGISAVSPGEYSGSYIIGRAIMDYRQVGSGSVPMFLGCSISHGSELGNVSITRTTGPEGIITEGTNSSIASNWEVRTTTNPSASDRNITFFWLPEFDNGKDISKIDLYGSQIGSDNYEKLNQSSVPVAHGNLRIYTQKRVERFNQVFTLSDNLNNLREPAIGQRIVSVFPNPFLDKLTISLENTRNYPVVVRIVNSTGQNVYQSAQQPQNNQVVLNDLGYLPQGNYWLQVYIHGSTASTHIIKIQ